ncbi:MAG TPA: spore coat U domain-containing protein [Thermoanaerobaculia bacterium]|nr:spore coat U domain-containing protein [Thermoanaerobaculia bacterium]
MIDLRRVALIPLLLLALAAKLEAASCFIQSVTPVTFGDYSVFSPGPLDIAGSLTIVCTPGTAATIYLSTGSSGTYAMRTMRSGAEVLDYNVYLDATRTVVFGNGSGGTGTAVFNVPPGPPGPSEDLEAMIQFYGRVFPLDDVAAGLYSDSLVITIDWTERSVTTTLPVSANVLSECLVSASDLDFGSYDPIGANAAAPLLADATLSVFCTRGTTASIGMNLGTSAVAGQRFMTGPGSQLAYGLFQDAARSQPWSLTSSMTASSSSKDVPVGNGLLIHGSIPGAQDAVAGNYVDTVQAVVNY